MKANAFRSKPHRLSDFRKERLNTRSKIKRGDFESVLESQKQPKPEWK